MQKVYIYKKFERFWHWTQAALIFFLALTGFEVHGSFSFLGYEQAVESHRVAAWMLLILIAFSIFWHFTTGEWRQYIPTFSKLQAQIRYYTVGIFKGEPHPTRKSVRKKLNPLQALTYLGFKLVMAPLLVITGIVYMFYRTIDANNMVIVSDIPLEIVAFLHTLGAYLIIMFAIVHVYMTTTGHTPTSNIRAMLTGYEDLEDDSEQPLKDENKKEE
ncbi:cytochrome b/b6 domain-containing protein [Marinilabilia salmonicolor]|jgi:thiosulfate reductase cytochrome b subunit|uniref:Thiosulfate reductase cytochrome b subunit n=1 Tax=Marinilabilia salmonicolor TaxID=989 RepID=A0A2T0XT55_9BACT|nr:cytochrome b/b6 domain-containing protein [Marinilabilia salmonicolor]PRZ02134.1 thiosulfate reductase cytochrome b subunit [Marinilabilia salmonicolor]RCW36088.1 thiosulfate reductase cytochrome b subunit [Marinilabilia salmonicolor]